MNVIVDVLEIEPGLELERVTTQIIPGVTLKVFDNKDATLFLGVSEVNFDWTLEAAEIFANIDTVEPIELLTVLTQLSTIC